MLLKTAITKLKKIQNLFIAEKIYDYFSRSLENSYDLWPGSLCKLFFNIIGFWSKFEKEAYIKVETLFLCVLLIYFVYELYQSFYQYFFFTDWSILFNGECPRLSNNPSICSNTIWSFTDLTPYFVCKPIFVICLYDQNLRLQ